MSLIDASIKPSFDSNLRKYNDWDLWVTLYKKGYEPVFYDNILSSTASRPDGISYKNIEDRERWKKKLYKKHGISLYAIALFSIFDALGFIVTQANFV